MTPTSSVMRERSRSRDPSPGLQLCSEHSDCRGAGGGRGDQALCTGQWISPSPEEPGGTHDASDSDSERSIDSDYSLCILQLYNKKQYQKMLRRHQQEGHGPEEHVHQEAGDQKQPVEDDDSIRDTDEDHDEPAGRKEQPLEDDDSINRDTDEDHDEPAGRKEQPLEDDDSINRDTDEDHDEPAGRKEQPLEDDDSIRDTDEDHDEPAGRKEQPLEDDDSINRDTDEDHDEPAGRKEQPLEDDDSIPRHG